ncbi:MAG: hypothetical protein ABEI52_10040, partial [Halobacteriaceae archaeon]
SRLTGNALRVLGAYCNDPADARRRLHRRAPRSSIEVPVPDRHNDCDQYWWALLLVVLGASLQPAMGSSLSW